MSFCAVSLVPKLFTVSTMNTTKCCLLFQSENHESEESRRTALQLSRGQAFCLPRRNSTPSDLNSFLENHAQLERRAKELHKTSSLVSLQERTKLANCINVLQGEVAHTTDQQGVDVLLSGEATTCHILAFRSTKSNSRPLTTLAHLDDCNPECLESILIEHIAHHQASSRLKPLEQGINQGENDDFGFYFDAVEHESHLPEHFLGRFSTMSPSSLSDPVDFPECSTHKFPMGRSGHSMEIIRADLHLVGGYNDSVGTSHRLSQDLLETWAHLAEQYSSEVFIQLCMAAISGLNVCDDANRAARGMGINTSSGAVFSIIDGLPKDMEGPAVEIRQARLWARAIQEARRQGNSPKSKSRSSIIHTRHSRRGELSVEPFSYEPHPQLTKLLQLDDQCLKNLTSTSPELEGGQFCIRLRRSLSFLQTVPSSEVFDAMAPKPLIFTRSAGNLHQWEIKK